MKLYHFPILKTRILFYVYKVWYDTSSEKLALCEVIWGIYGKFLGTIQHKQCEPQ